MVNSFKHRSWLPCVLHDTVSICTHISYMTKQQACSSLHRIHHTFAHNYHVNFRQLEDILWGCTTNRRHTGVPLTIPLRAQKLLLIIQMPASSATSHDSCHAQRHYKRTFCIIRLCRTVPKMYLKSCVWVEM